MAFRLLAEVSLTGSLDHIPGGKAAASAPRIDLISHGCLPGSRREPSPATVHPGWAGLSGGQEGTWQVSATALLGATPPGVFPEPQSYSEAFSVMGAAHPKSVVKHSEAKDAWDPVEALDGTARAWNCCPPGWPGARDGAEGRLQSQARCKSSATQAVKSLLVGHKARQDQQEQRGRRRRSLQVRKHWDYSPKQSSSPQGK